MHKSRFCALVIDFPDGELDAAARFWAAALGREFAGTDGNYAKLKTGKDEPVMLLQKVDHPPRVHLDIETDDVDAEVARLERLGAKRVNKVQTWWVMEAPTGHRFCVVRPQRGPLDDRANTW